MATDGPSLVEAHLNNLPEPQRSTLFTVRSRVLSLLPTADEAITYNMPTVLLADKGIIAYDGFKHHCSVFPMSGGVLKSFDPPKGAAVTSKGTLQFPIDQPLPMPALRELIARRLAEIGRTDHGRRIEFYANGVVKAEGAMRHGKLHGAWTWYRADGSVKRTGHFNDGVKTGTWRTFDAAGQLVKETKTPAARTTRK